MITSSGSNSSSIQLTDSEDQTENYSVGELYTSDFFIGIANTVGSAGNDVTPRMSADWIVHIT